MSKRLHVKFPLFLSDFIQTWIFSTDLKTKHKYQASSKSVQWEQSFNAGVWTDGHEEADSRFSQFCKRAKTCKSPTGPHKHANSTKVTNRCESWTTTCSDQNYPSFPQAIQNIHEAFTHRTIDSSQSPLDSLPAIFRISFDMPPVDIPSSHRVTKQW